MSNLTWQSLNTADTPTWSVGLGSLGSGAYSLSSVIDNTSTGSNGGLFTNAILELLFGSAVTAAAGNPTVQTWLLEAADGTNYASPNAAGLASYSLPNSIYSAVASQSVSVILIPLPLRPLPFKLDLWNNLGVAFPSTVTAKLWRFGLQG